jgi:DNA gyrase subunit A
MIPIEEFDDKHFLVFSTKKGLVKKTKLPAYSRPRVTGIWAIKLRKGDELVDTKISDGTMEIILATNKGQAARFSEKLVRPVARSSVWRWSMRNRSFSR